MAISSEDQDSIDTLKGNLVAGGIGLFIGTSGAGKFTLVNLLQEEFSAKVNAVKRQEGKGKHTTTSSTFVYCPDLDYYVVDTPGFKGIDSHYAMDMQSLMTWLQLVNLAIASTGQSPSVRSKPLLKTRLSIRLF
ncbi:Putative ribosome biogenesis GTPase RsgA [Chlamydia trachomatis]|nr:Putative ribosome biogenesis GTPase RsgA [Chlamydia trachomatis]